MARELFASGEFMEVFVDTPIEVCMTRDPKGLYRKAMDGEIKNFTGLDSPYELPDQAEITLKTVGTEPAALAVEVVDYLRSAGIIP